jgi:hypothetical protein
MYWQVFLLPYVPTEARAPEFYFAAWFFITISAIPSARSIFGTRQYGCLGL